MRTLEAIAEHSYSTATRVSVSLYATRLSDAIILDPACSGCTKYINLNGYQQVDGLEMAWQRHDPTGMRAYASLTLQTSLQKPNDIELAASPQTLFKSGASFPLPWERTFTGGELQYTGETKGMLVSGTRLASAPGYMRLNIFASAPLINKHWSITARVDNVLDQSGYITQPLNFDPIQRTPAGGRLFALRIAGNLN